MHDGRFATLEEVVEHDSSDIHRSPTLDPNLAKLIRFNTGTAEFYDLQTDSAETSNLLAGGIAAMSSTQQARYDRLRFNLGAYSSTATPAASGHRIDASGFSLIVPENAPAIQTLWQSTDLDFWAPVTAATPNTSGSINTFTAPPPLPEKAFFSVLTEKP